MFDEDPGVRLYVAAANTTLNPKSLDSTGGTGAHDNHQPSQRVNFMIALQGVYPPKPSPQP